MTISQFITFLTWSFASSLLVIFTIVATIIYRGNQQKVFKFYAIYCFLILLYILTKIPDFFYPFSEVYRWKNQLAYQGFYWFIQVLYHNAYLSFAIHFLNLKETKPKLTQAIFTYQKIIIPTFAVLTLLVMVGVLTPKMLLWGFSYIFIELHLIICFLIIYAVRKTHNFFRNYFVLASLIYMVLILFSFAISALGSSLGNIRPPAIFYIAIIVECSVFSAGLGIRIRNVYREKIKFQTDLNLALQKTQAHMELELTQQKLITQNTNLNSQVLRSQMNSHFIFNVLTSIKLFIHETETEKALFYLSKFARFIRCVLDGSIYENNTLQKELETLELYLSIEKMRFNDELDYSIDVEKSIRLSDIQFPALLLQPFVENALWHGLHQKEGEKKVEILVTKSESHYQISIRDNGVWQAPKTNKNIGNSQGLKIVDKRIDLFNTNNNAKLSYEIVPTAEGTIVNLLLALNSKSSI